MAATVHGQQIDKVAGWFPTLAGDYGLPQDKVRPLELLFAIETYYALLIRLLLRQTLGTTVPDEANDWFGSDWTDPLMPLLEQRVGVAMTKCGLDQRLGGTCPGDLFQHLYQAIFPRPVRHALGEYYTPEWLVREMLDEAGYTGRPGTRLLDPACGSGVFVTEAIRRIRAQVGAEDVLHWIVEGIAGYDLNPLAVLTARANFLIAVGDLLPRSSPIRIPIYLRDSILESKEAPASSGPFDYVVGNPPWIAWDDLPVEYREATKPLWRKYGLFSLSGTEARHGGGKKDLSMLMTYVAADRYLKDGGRLAVVITQTLFQTKGAGDGFRRFRLGPDGPPLGVLRVNDLVAARPFPSAANWTATLLLQKGRPTEYPVPYVKWSVATPGLGNSPPKDPRTGRGRNGCS